MQVHWDTEAPSKEQELLFFKSPRAAAGDKLKSESDQSMATPENVQSRAQTLLRLLQGLVPGFR
jgi:hypothetical protein